MTTTESIIANIIIRFIRLDVCQNVPLLLFLLRVKHFSSYGLKGTNFLRYHKKNIGFVLLVQGKTYNNKISTCSPHADMFKNFI